MMGGAYVLGWLLAHPTWLVAYVATSAVATTGILYCALTEGRGQHRAEDAITEEWVAMLGDDDVPAFLAAPPQAPPAGRPPPEAPAAAETPTPPTPPPPVHHDEYAPLQYWHEPTDVPGPEVGTADSAHGDPVTVAGDPKAHQAAVAVGAAIAATHARIEAAHAARKAELAAEAERTRPWEDDTGTFTLEALGLKEVA